MSRHGTILLGPQRHEPTLAATVDALGLEGPLATITAGWEERENLDLELSEHLGGRARNLRLHHRAEDIFARDAELHTALWARHDRLRRLQSLYRLRLGHALDAARALLREEGDDPLLEAERESAIDAVRELDEGHLRLTQEVHAEFEETWRPHERDAVAGHIRELEQSLADCSAVCIAGGHVAILLNRLRLFDLRRMLAERAIIAWSAGAMALADRVVLFHDSPPQGAGNAEVLEAGLGLAPGIVPLPHARRRLRLDDPLRVSLFARRFGGALCAVLDAGTRFDFDGESWTGTAAAQQLTSQGTTAKVGAA